MIRKPRNLIVGYTGGGLTGCVKYIEAGSMAAGKSAPLIKSLGAYDELVKELDGKAVGAK